MSTQRHGEEDPNLDAEEAPQLPLGTRDYVACRKCHTILTQPQFAKDGCYKCLEEDRDMNHVTNKFTGFVGLVAPEHSWVARMIGCTHMPSGIYAATLEDDEEDDDAENGTGDPFGHHDEVDDEDAYDDADDEPVRKGDTRRADNGENTSKKRSRGDDELELDDILELGE
jgi:transcription elongation factor SPT4